MPVPLIVIAELIAVGGEKRDKAYEGQFLTLIAKCDGESGSVCNR